MVESKDVEAWLDRWTDQDFSWQGLTKKPQIARIGGNHLQGSLREVHGGSSDEQLIADGWLIEVPGRGLFHVGFVPPEWASTGTLSTKALDQKKSDFWDARFTRNFKESFDETLVGFQLTSPASGRLIKSTRANCSWVRFEGNVSPPVVSVNRTFDNCLFTQQVQYKGKYASTTAPEHRFQNCVMPNGLSLHKFSGLGRIVLTGSYKAISASECDLSAIALTQCEVDSVNISRSAVKQDCSIQDCTVGLLDIVDSHFESSFVVGSSSFERGLTIWSCRFTQRVSFTRVSWPPPGLERVVARGSTFEAIVEFAGPAPPPVQLFNQAYFEKGLSFENFTEGQWKASFKNEVKSNRGAAWRNFDGPEYVQTLEGGCRTLRKIAEASGDVHSEQLWRRSEIITRRKRPDCPRAERFFSKAYGLVADYGLSIPLPFFSLVITAFVFSVFYAWIGGGQFFSSRVDWHSVGQGTSFSLHRAFPLGVFGDATNEWRESLLGQTGSGYSILMRSAATLQSVISAVLIFLGVMAVRRKFKIG